jgi:hypothetical protein
MIMTSSLKAYAPLLACRLGTTPAALYERQRALVRAGMLDQSAGRGPGSGVQVGPYPVALLLIAILATDSLSETAEKVRIFAAAKARGGLCPLTGEQAFVEAVARVLDRGEPHWRKIESITIRRTSGQGVIASGDKLTHTDSIFAAHVPIDAKLRPPTRLVVNAMLTRDLIMDIATDLKKFADSAQPIRPFADKASVSLTPPRYGSESSNRGSPKRGKKQ